MTRRALLAALTAAAARGAGRYPFRFAVCNETFAGASFATQCALARKTGYTGIELTPAALGPDPRRVMADAGLAFVGLHNLLSAPAGLHATTAQMDTYRRTWDHVRRLIDLCATLGGGVMVFGSGKQRHAEPGMSAADAVARLRDGLAGVAPHAERAGVTILLEPLAPHLSNIVHTLGEAVGIARQIGSRAVQSIFDVHNTAAETAPAAELVAAWRPYIRHVHLNEMDGRRPGLGHYDFRALLGALAANRYAGWLSLEVFDFQPSGEEVAAAALGYLERMAAK